MRIIFRFFTWQWFLVLSMVVATGCAQPLGRYPCQGPDCFGTNLWQKALNKIASKNFPEMRYQGQVFSDDWDNAWTTQGHEVNITSSLMMKLDRRGELYVLSAAAHEIAHLQANHYRDQNGEQSAEGSAKALNRGNWTSHFKFNEKDEATAALSRRQELEADALAVQYLERLGYTREDYLKFLYWMKRNLEDAPRSALATHPTTGERMEYIRNLNSSAR